MLKCISFAAAAALLLCLTMSISVFAGNLAITPSTTEIDVLPGTTSSIILSIENGLEQSYSFRLSSAQFHDLQDGYDSFPDLTWIKLITEDTSLAPSEQAWLTVEITIPDDESLVGQRWVASINISCVEEPLFHDSSIILVTVGQAQPPYPQWGLGGGITAVCVIGAVLWTHWKDRQRHEWTTGLKTKHWLE